MDTFSETLNYRVVTLRFASDLVRFSFIVRNSISYLDLEFYQHSTDLRYHGISCDCYALKRSNSFINTEENCRKFFTKSRSLLYKLNLDLPKGIEFGLKNTSNCYSFEQSNCSPYIGKVIPNCGFDISIISDFVKDAIRNKKQKLKILVWILKLKFSHIPLLYVLDIQTVDKFIDCFYPKIADTGVFKDFIMNFDFVEWISRYEKPEILEYLLYYARHYGREDLTEEDFPIDETIDTCVINRHFLNICPVLKYVNVPGFSEDDYRLYFIEISSLRPHLTTEKLYKIQKRMKRERIHHMFQIIWMYIDSKLNHCTEDASEALRLIWCSVAEAFIGLKEFKTTFRGIFRVNELKNIYDFYAEAVGNFSESVEPRSLQHLCRSTVRRTLSENHIWIPEGIRLTSMPKLIQSYLNLEKVFVTPKKCTL